MTRIYENSSGWRTGNYLLWLLCLMVLAFAASCATSEVATQPDDPATRSEAPPLPESATDQTPSADIVAEATPSPRVEAPATVEPQEPVGGPCEFTNPTNPFDDPNPPHDGTEGRYPVSANPIPAGYPTPRTTGFCGAGLLAADLVITDGMTITEDGAVLQGLDVVGGVLVQANNVTIRDSRITANGSYALHLADGFNDLTVETTRIRGVGADVSSAVYAQGFITLREVHISGGNDQMKATAGALVEHSYFTGAFVSPGTHNDVVQVRTGSNYTFRHNSMFGPWQQPTSVFLFQAKAGAGGGPISDVLIEDNYLSGGGYTITTMAPDFEFTNGVVRNNRIELDSWRFGWWHDTADASYSDNEVLPSMSDPSG